MEIIITLTKYNTCQQSEQGTHWVFDDISGLRSFIAADTMQFSTISYMLYEDEIDCVM